MKEKLLGILQRDPATVAAVRRTCDGRGFPGRCRERICLRARRCQAPWRSSFAAGPVLPPCLLAPYEAARQMETDAELALIAVRRVAADALELPHPQAYAECDWLGPLTPGGDPVARDPHDDGDEDGPW